VRKRMFKGGARFVDEACNLLHELHQHDLMHGDAHAGNMMYTADCRKLMLIDFGRVHVVNKKDMLTARGQRKYNQNLFEWEYFQVVRDWRLILRNQRGISRDVTALQLINAFVNGMEFQLEQRREAERREIEML
jgi:aminoglycoside phosphotransferase (APT) family kinase protein